ncbi:hypothetical protein FGO68_gene1373 [Halteria grandinella]|uniref:Uncharacterized protein n=1 Tax=Halteria grandinella TaxID=5974 RepID=A0A8J8TA25_HALGN|nr:hypothetical protein FGO68_gene1373 [Halteria grandinella]
MPIFEQNLNERAMHIGGDAGSQFHQMPQQRLRLQCPQTLSFQYIKEDIYSNKSAQFGIELSPIRIDGEIIVFSKEDILVALFKDDISEDRFRIKFFNSIQKSFDSIENELLVHLHLGAFKKRDLIQESMLRPGQPTTIQLLASERVVVSSRENPLINTNFSMSREADMNLILKNRQDKRLISQ